jgi:EmrB/QacA subfamily drug resistance transporter
MDTAKTTVDHREIGSRKWWAIGAISLAAIAFSLDLTVLNLALPTLSTALHATSNQLQWIVDAYALVLAVLTLPAGLLGDKYGRKKFLLIALLIFGTASALCAYSHSVDMLIAARVLLGVGAAFILPLAFSVLSIFFGDEERPKAIAVLMGGVFAAYPLGPILGGWLLTHYWWGSVFLINVPIVLIALVAVALLLPETSNPESHKLDFMGIVLSSLGLTGITYGAIQAESKGWGSSQIITSLITGVVLLILFVLWEQRKMRLRQQPLVDLKLFNSAAFTWGTILMTSVNFSLFGLLFTLPQYLQDVQGKNAMQAGYYLLPMIGGLMIGSVVMSKLVNKIGAKFAVATGFSFMAIGLILGTRTTLQVSDLFIIVWTGVIGLGLGFAMPSAADAALGALSPEKSGVGSALVTAIRQVGGTLGVAILGTLLGTSYRSKLDLPGLPNQLVGTIRGSVTAGVAVAHQLHSGELLYIVGSAFVHGMDTMLGVCGGIAICAVVLALLFLPNKPAVSDSSHSSKS